MNKEDMKTSSSDSLSTTAPPPCFSSLPYDMVLNCLARISRIHRPALSPVSKSFQSLMASRELHAIRSLIGKTEDCLYVCLDLNRKNPNPRWFTLVPIPKRQKLLPITNSFPYQHPESSTIVSIGSDMYLIGGLVDEKRSRRVLILDCRSHQWHSLPDMIVPRDRPAAEVIDGKIYVVGGCDENTEHWGEVYDPKTQIWEPLSPTTLDHLTTQKSVVRGNRLVMGENVYEMNGSNLNLKTYSSPECKCRFPCLVEVETNVWYEIYITGINLLWRDTNDVRYEYWTRVTGLEELLPKPHFRPYLVSVANSGGRKVSIWWKTSENILCRKTSENILQSRFRSYKSITDIWCAEISFQRYGVKELRGFIEWSKSVLTFDGDDSGKDFFLHSGLVKH